MPSPPWAFVEAWSTCTNNSKMRGSMSGAIPMPLSRTRSTAMSPSRSAVSQMRPPGSVYLAAFVSRLPTTWASRTGSASSSSDSDGRRTLNSMPLGVHERLHRLDRTGDDRGEFDPLPAEFDLAPHDPGHVQQVVHQPDEMLHLPLHHLP